MIPRGYAFFNKQLPLILENAENNLVLVIRSLVFQLKELIDDLTKRIANLNKEIEHWHKECAASLRIAEIPGIGPMTATALVASIGNPHSFSYRRQVSAWIGLVPKQFSIVGKSVLLGISKRGDGYLRRLLVHGARAVVGHLKQQPNTYTHRWLSELLKRKHTNVAIVALANRNARIAWFLLANNQDYNPELLSA